MTDRITGATLIAWGYKPGAWFKGAIDAANRAENEEAARGVVATMKPTEPETIPLRAPSAALHPHMNIRGENAHEADNIIAVGNHMRELMRLPTVFAAAVMPDACPTGSAPGTIPVGGVVATRNAIHPGMHSADICCSMAITVFDRDADPTKILDAGMALSHFGGGGRHINDNWALPPKIMEKFETNAYLKSVNIIHAAGQHFGTQGDGNHFFFVGRVASSGQIALVTHHGSRKPGAMLYKMGMATAEVFRQRISPQTPKHNAWIVADSNEGESYWAALQIIREWTKANHYAIHDRIANTLGLSISDRFWNEHNFVFRKSDGLFYHGKGATPAFDGWADDATPHTLIPLNMAEPILIARGRNAANGLGFAPHGAGRNYSRTEYLRLNAGKTVAELMEEQTKGIDVRFFHHKPDASELPGAYKNAAAVRAQIAEFGLADVVDQIDPIGSIMAGDWQEDAPWRIKKAAKAAARS